MFTVDLHLDLSMNAMEWNRDLRQRVDDINAREAGRTDLPGRGRATVSFPSLRAGGIGLVVATQIARFVPPGGTLSGWHSPEQAWAQTQGQLAWYRAMEEAGEMEMIRDRSSLERLLERMPQGDEPWAGPIGYVLSLEGADSLVRPEFLERAHAYGLRAVGPGHYGPGRYAHGTNATGRMEALGIELLQRMDALNMILDATHLCDDAFWQAMDLYQGPVWASHNNCRSIVDHNPVQGCWINQVHLPPRRWIPKIGMRDGTVLVDAVGIAVDRLGGIATVRGAGLSGLAGWGDVLAVAEDLDLREGEVTALLLAPAIVGA